MSIFFDVMNRKTAPQNKCYKSDYCPNQKNEIFDCLKITRN